MVLTNDKRSEIQKRENSRFVSPSAVHVFVAKTSDYHTVSYRGIYIPVRRHCPPSSFGEVIFWSI